MDFPLNDFPDACILLNEKDEIIGLNPAAQKMFEQAGATALGNTWAEVCAAGLVCQDKMASTEGRNALTSNVQGGQRDFIEIQVRSFKDREGQPLGQMAVLRPQEGAIQQEVLRQHNEMMEAFQETTFDLHSSLDLKVVLKNIITRACKLMNTQHGYLDMITEEGVLEPVVGLGALTELTASKVIRGKGVSGIIWQSGKPLFIPDYDRWPDRVASFPRGQIRAILGMPLLLSGQFMGVIAIARGLECDQSFSEEDISALRRFADLAVLALRNARLFKQARDEIDFRRKTEHDLRNANQVLQFQIERIELLQAQLREQAVQDSLTGLFNRRYLQETLEVELARARRSGFSLAVLMMDCDRLKFINDIYGHKTGDEALVLIANVIRESVRAGDIACRYGGDEFVVLMLNVSEEKAFERAEDLRNRIAEKKLLHTDEEKDEEVKVNISVGIAMFPSHGERGESLLHRADQALYDAKNRGKNQVFVYSGDSG